MKLTDEQIFLNVLEGRCFRIIPQIQRWITLEEVLKVKDKNGLVEMYYRGKWYYIYTLTKFSSPSIDLINKRINYYLLN